MGVEAGGHAPGTLAAVPDVSVIVAVYNTMPYLTKCLTSLVGQSIGLKRLEIVAVDDGSTDGSGDELDRFAQRYPGTLTVIRQPNSGGPAAPSNRALDRATGRYVFFVGADDYLGSEALERLVAAADEYGADVVAGKMVGDNGRYVPMDIFAQTNYDVDLFNSALPFAISNTKLFRRDLVEMHGLRYIESLPFGSDQPFTVAACVHAKRIAVLADYDYYYAVKRKNRGNITYRSTHELRLRCTEEIMAHTAALLGPGPERDAIMRRSFTSELSKLTRPAFLKIDRDEQEHVTAGIGRLADRYLTDPIRDGLDASRRVRLSLAQHGYTDDLIAVVAQNKGPKHAPFVSDNGRLYLAYDCFRDERMLPDEWFLITDDPYEMIVRQLDVRTVTWQASGLTRHVMTVTIVSPVTVDRLGAATIRIGTGETAGTVSVKAREVHEGSVIKARFELQRLMAECPPLGGLRDLVVRITIDGTTVEAPLRLPRSVKKTYRIGRVGHHVYMVGPDAQPDREFAIGYTPTTIRAVVGRLTIREVISKFRDRVALRSRLRKLVRRGPAA